MSNEITTQQVGDLANKIQLSPDLQEKVFVGGDLSVLSPAERLSYISAVCKSVGLNSLTRPLEYITLNGRLTLYARKDAAEQLRSINGISLKIAERQVIEGVYVVTAQATDSRGRHDESTGAVAIDHLKGDARANAMMKAETKAKRRVTLSISGLGLLDESEIESIPAEREIQHPPEPRDPKKSMTERVQETINNSQSVQDLIDAQGIFTSWYQDKMAMKKYTESQKNKLTDEFKSCIDLFNRAKKHRSQTEGIGVFLDPQAISPDGHESQ